MLFGPSTYHRGKRNFGTGYDMMDGWWVNDARSALTELKGDKT